MNFKLNELIPLYNDKREYICDGKIIKITEIAGGLRLKVVLQEDYYDQTLDVEIIKPN